MNTTKTSYKIQKNTSVHDKEHQFWSRRSFLQALGLAGGGTMMLANTPLSITKPSLLNAALGESENDRILVLIRLKGGNDGLNTVIPLNQYDLYANSRPNLRIDNYFNLSDEYAMPNFMNALYPLWQEGQMKIVHGVGYQNTNLSHFAGSDIIASGDTSGEAADTGWIGRYFEDRYPDYVLHPTANPPAIEIGYNASNILLKGQNAFYGLHFNSVSQLQSLGQTGNFHDLENLPDCTYGEQLRFLRQIVNNTVQYAGVIRDAYSAGKNNIEYNATLLEHQLAVIGRLINGNLGTKIYMVTLGGFDTHANQEATHQQLLTTLSNAVARFFEDLAISGNDRNVLAMTFSEFGRRVEENGSHGTDHGTAAPTLFFGPSINGSGFVGTHPSLSNLDATGNMMHSIDFRSVYHTVMTEWLCIDSEVANHLLGTYNTLPLGFSCGGKTTRPEVPFGRGEAFSHFITYNTTGSPTLHYYTPTATHVVIKLYNMLGQEIATLRNEFMLAGTHKLSIRDASAAHLTSSRYIYRITAAGKSYGNAIIIR